MKRLAFAALAAIALIGVASAQPDQRYRTQVQRPGFAPETESETNSMTFLLGRGYAIVAGWEGTLVLGKNDRVYLCPYARYREGANRGDTQLISQPCQHLREGMRT